MDPVSVMIGGLGAVPNSPPSMQGEFLGLSGHQWILIILVLAGFFVASDYIKGGR